MKELSNKYDIIIAPASMATIGKFKNLTGWGWSFVGTDPCLRETIVKNLGDVNRHCYGRELQEISIQYKELFVNWIAKVGEIQDHPIWWATRIAYKSPLKSDFFLLCCSLLLIRKWIDEGVRKRIVIVENPWLIKACFENFFDEKVYIIRGWSYIIKSFLVMEMVSFAKLLEYLVGGFAIWTANRFFMLIYRNVFKEMLKKDYDVAICTWIEDRSFNGPNYTFSDPFLGNLNSFLSKRQLDSICISLPFIRFRLLKKSYLSQKVIPGICFAGLLDVIISCLKMNPVKRNQDIPKLDKLEIRPILDCEIIFERWLVVQAYLHYKIIKNIFGRKKIACKFIIYPFENQPWDKMMLFGIRESRAKCKIIACHNITAPTFYLNFFLGKNEEKIHPQPDVIMANGKYWTKVLKDAGYTCPVENGGSLRYNMNVQTTTKKSDNAINNILVLLSNSLDYTLDLLFYLLRASQRDKVYLLKPHPDTPEKTIRKFIPDFPDNFRFVVGSMEESMKEVEWAIHIGTTAAIECMMNGINVVKYLPERIDLDPLLGLNVPQFEVTDKDMFDYKTKAAFSNPDSDLIAEPFKEDAWIRIINVDSELI
jgi:hypothetical protein